MSTAHVRAGSENWSEELRAVQRLRDALNSALRGKSAVIENVIVCLLARGHLLLEDRPGLGKTTLAKALARAIGGRFARVQCTPDLLPSDITGFNIFNQKSREFDFRRGPVFADILLADEINRATPRTQSALLEAMAERQVTVDAARYPLSDEFFVMATQNPHEQHGTYPLPEAQLDRFAMKLHIGYPDSDDEVALLQSVVNESADGSPEDDAPVFAAEELARVQRIVAGISVARPVSDYLVRLAHATRNHDRVALGLSPRAVLIWQRAAQANAFLNQREFITPDDVQDVAVPVLSVRLCVEADDAFPVLQDILDSVAVPDYSFNSRAV